MKRPHPTIALLLWLTAAYAAGLVGTLGTLRGMAGAYPTLVKPAWTPPAWLFSPVWTVVYALMGVAAWRVGRGDAPHRAALLLWWLALTLSALWPWLFFGWDKRGPAFGEIGVLWIAVLATTIAFSAKERAAAWLLVLPLAWIGSLTVFNLAIWRLN